MDWTWTTGLWSELLDWNTGVDYWTVAIAYTSNASEQKDDLVIIIFYIARSRSELASTCSPFVGRGFGTYITSIKSEAKGCADAYLIIIIIILRYSEVVRNRCHCPRSSACSITYKS